MSTIKLTAVMCLACGFFATGCATYVNIPAMQGDLAWHSPNHSDVLKVQTAAIVASADHWSQGQVFGVNPLPDTQSMRYFEMIKKIGNQATADPEDDAPRVEVRQLYIRGFNAHVDVVRQLHPRSSVPGETAEPKQVQDQVVTPYAYATSLNDMTLPGPPLEDRHLVTVYLQWTPFIGWQATRTRVWRMNVEQALRISALQMMQMDQAQSDSESEPSS